MATINSESSTAACAHCGKDVPTSNIDLHFAHCSRNLKKCSICGDMLPKKHENEHYNNNHAPVECSLCGQTVERELLTLHNDDKCPKRIITCEYCEFPLPAVDLLSHQEVCGNRTEYCNLCKQYVRLCEWNEHEIQLHCNSDGSGPTESSRVGAPERDGDVRRRQAHDVSDVSRRRMMFTMAVTGAALLVGSFFLQKRIDGPQLQ